MTVNGWKNPAFSFFPDLDTTSLMPVGGALFSQGDQKQLTLSHFFDS